MGCVTRETVNVADKVDSIQEILQESIENLESKFD